MAKQYDAEQLTLQYFKDFEYQVDGPGTGGHIYSVIKYCHPTKFVFKQNGRSDAEGVYHQVQVFGLYCAQFKRRYAHEKFHNICSQDIEGKPGCKRVYIEREERCYYQDENTPESNFYPSLDKPGDMFLSIVEFDEDGLMTLMSDYYDISGTLQDRATNPNIRQGFPTLEEVKYEISLCADKISGGKDYTEGLEEALERSRREIYLEND